MSGSSIPYHLRPHKAVDRRLFIDLLMRYERWRSLQNDIYISMGAYPLEDHKLIHRMLGVTRLITFDADENIVSRQKFNRPLENLYATCKLSGDMISDLDEVVREADITEFDGYIVWLDYTSPKQLGEQIREFQFLLDKLAEGDVVRVTVNAHPPAYGEGRSEAGPKDAGEIRKERFDRIEERIGEFLPHDAGPNDMTPDRLPQLISRAFGKAASLAFPATGDDTFAPLSIVRYQDGQQMLSMTGAICKRSRKADLWSRMEMDAWPFSSHEWKSVHHLAVPDLTVRERMYLERSISFMNSDDIQSGLGFNFGNDIDIGEFLKSYKSFYRFYPSLLSADL